MSGVIGQQQRQTIPRCLDFDSAGAIGLVKSIRQMVPAPRIDLSATRVLTEWKRSPSVATAVDLMFEAMVSNNNEVPSAIAAANMILDETPESHFFIRDLANNFLNQPRAGGINITMPSAPSVIYGRIARLKRLVRENPYNPIAWSDMALWYGIIGQYEQAKFNLDIALNLGSSNRHILRSASHCFLQMEEPERALKLLNDSQLCSRDPWIASAEIAISDASNLKSRCMINAKRLIDDENFTNYSRSELAVSLGTVEMKHGSTRNVKRLIRKALLDPTENALAQAEWMATELGTHMEDIIDVNDIQEFESRIPAAFEAQARNLFAKKVFSGSLQAAELWDEFQPMSSIPVIFSSFIAGVCMDDDDAALRILEGSFPAQRKDPTFTNNYAFSLARSGNVTRAMEELGQLDISKLNQHTRYIITATRGLIAFRDDNPKLGRKLYQVAESGFKKMRDNRNAAIAKYYWAIEEDRIGAPKAKEMLRDVKEKIEKMKIFELSEVVKKILL